MPSIDVASAIHKARHASGGADPLTPADIGAVPASRWLTGTGSPEGVVTAPVGTTYTDTTTGEEWHKRTGTGNTGWRGPLVMSDHPMLVQTEVTIASWDASGVITSGALPSGWSPAPGLAGHVKLTRSGTAVVARLRNVVAGSGSFSVPVGYRPAIGLRVLIKLAATGSPMIGTFSGPGRALFVAAGTYSDEPRECISTPWLVPQLPTPA